MTKVLSGIMIALAAVTGEPTSAADLRVLPKAPQSSRLPTPLPKEKPAVVCSIDPTGIASCSIMVPEGTVPQIIGVPLR